MAKTDWLAQWKSIKAEFTRLTGRKKPSLKLAGVIRKSSGLEGALKTCEKKYAPCDDRPTEENAEPFAQSVQAFSVKKNAYMKVLGDAIEKEGAAGGVYMKGLDILHKKLDALEKTLQSQVGMVRSGAKKVGVQAALAENLLKNCRAACARARVLIARVKANPSPELFNKNIVTAARDINQNVGNIGKLRKKGYEFPEKHSTEEADSIFKVMMPWAGGQRMLKADTTPEWVLRELRAFSNMVEGADHWASD